MPNAAPKILFIIPNDAVSAIFVNNFPAKEIKITIITKVLAKATICTYFSVQSTLSFKKSAAKYEKWIAPYKPIANATKEVTSTKKPFIKPRTKPKSNRAARMMSNVFIMNF